MRSEDLPLPAGAGAGLAGFRGAQPAARPAPASTRRIGRELLFVASFLLAWVTLEPFPSLGDARWVDAGAADSLNTVAYLVYAALGACALVVFSHGRSMLGALRRPAYLLMLGWLTVSVVTSTHPELSTRRLPFALVIIVLGAAAPLLPASRERFADLLAGLAAAVLLLCYLGVLVVPDLAIHQVTDLVEPRLAGNWRGAFNHKNVAGEMMGVFIFIGLFVARVRSGWVGWAIVASAGVFLVFTEAKSATGFLPIVLALAWVSRRAWAFRLRIGLFLAIVVGLNTLSVGSLYSPTIASLTERLVSDPTFTGRTEIWQVAVDWIPKRPLFGFGYGAFWQTDEVMYSGRSTVERDGGATNADHAHNAFLNLAVTTGIPGAILAFICTVLLPFRDLMSCQRRRSDPALIDLFLRIWTFAVANCAFESILFARGDPMWFTMLVAIFGLRYLSVYHLDER